MMILWSTAFVAEFFKASSSAGGVRDTHEHIPDQVVQLRQNPALGQVDRFLEVMIGLDKVVVFFHAVPMSAHVPKKIRKGRNIRQAGEILKPTSKIKVFCWKV